MKKYLSNNIEDYPDGIILAIDKPYRWTSADVIRKIKWAACKHFGNKKLKVGHAGTLDPLATGILLVCIGKATKKADELQKSPKQYVAGISFGATTASYDLEKEVVPCAMGNASRKALEKLLPSFIGEQEQIAPLFSAKSVDGVRVYELARKLYKEGLPIEENSPLQANKVSIYDLQLLEWLEDGPRKVEDKDDHKFKINVSSTEGFNLPTAMLQVDCSKGCYIRSLARDLGEALGSGAFLSSLRRTKNGGFDISEALTIDQALSLFSFSRQDFSSKSEGEI